jgi:hypothetical protein
LEHLRSLLNDTVTIEVPHGGSWARVQALSWRDVAEDLDDEEVVEEETRRDRCCPFCDKRLDLFPQGADWHIAQCSGWIPWVECDGTIVGTLSSSISKRKMLVKAFFLAKKKRQ